MPKLSPVRLQLIRLIAAYDKPFTTHELRLGMPTISPQTISNYLSEFCQINAIERVQKGVYRVLNRELLMDIIGIELDLHAAYRAIRPTALETISEEDAKNLNRLQRFAEALYSKGHPVGRLRREELKKEAEAVIDEMNQFIKNLRFKQLPKVEVNTRLYVVDRDVVIKSWKRDYPEHWEAYLELFDSYLNDLGVPMPTIKQMIER